ncbi:regulatory protein, luxR family [Haloechinothrix alba]|uniref:Regulatory protein, luxR family n=1 Tax=Haloechinothrix alba TaxID=664784 RepID=A0A238VGS6_9PSEU|nr:helix-turn-helix transcriptional regulator [Haloechinothrix alba]SNR32893.1 regulatory protein, luxR family [Haloechinothrix alba]
MASARVDQSTTGAASGADAGSDIAEQVRRGMRGIAQLEGVSAAIGGGVARSGEKLVLSELLEMRTCLLLGSVIRPGIGLGGMALQRRRPVVVDNYVESTGITHHFDRAVIADNLTGAVAIPLQVRGTIRAVLYGATRDGSAWGERTVDAATATVRNLANEIALEEEVQRRVRLHLRQREVEPSTGPDAHDLAEVRAELASIADSITDAGTRSRLVALSDRLVAGGERDGGTRARLSPRELEVLRQVAVGRTNSEIADSLGVLPTTVKTHLKNTMRKLGARNRMETVSVARNTGLLR